jgi:hypothetical protein
MPRINSMPWESMMMRFDKKNLPPYGNTNCREYMLSLHFTSWWANNLGVLHDGDGQIMLCSKLWWYEGMWYSRIKQSCCKVWVCKEHTQYHILGLLGFLYSDMVDLSIGEVRLPLRELLLIGSLGQLPGGTILSHVAWQSTLETCTKSLTSLRGDFLLGPGC